MEHRRLISLDMLRGFDLFLLVFLQPLILSVLCHFDQSQLAKAILYQLDHEVWIGFRFWDIVMPLFLFMSGVALPFSMSSIHKNDRNRFLVKTFRRTIILWLLGMVVQGNILTLSPDGFVYFSNTLQSIAIGYFITAMTLFFVPSQRQVWILACLLLAYWVPMTIAGDFSKEGNLCYKIDEFILGSHRGDPSYTWILSSLNFGVTVMFGAFAGKIVRHKLSDYANLKMLVIVGAVLMVAGLLVSMQMPIIKRIWSTSMTLFSGGICFLLLSLFYYIFDYKKLFNNRKWLLYFGMNSIMAYMLGEWLNFRVLTNQITFGLERFTGDYYNIVLTSGQVLVVYLILRLLFKHNKFIKI